MLFSITKSISQRFIFWLAIIIASTLLVFFVVFIGYDARSTEKALNQQADHILSFSKQSLASAMWQYNHEYVKDYIESLFLYSDIVFAQGAIESQIIKSKIRDGYSHIDFYRNFNDDEFIVRKSTVEYKKNEVGNIVFTMSKERVAQQVFRNSLAAGLLLLLIATIISLTMIVLFRINILNPLVELDKSARKIAKGKLDTPIDTSSEDEIGQLAKTFNHMMQNIRSITASRDELNHEIGERRRAEDALREKESALSMAQRSASVGSFVWKLDTDRVLCSDEMLRIWWHQSQKEYLRFPEEIMEPIHRGDRERIANALTCTVETGVPYDAEFRIVSPDGDLRFIHGTGLVEYDRNGKPMLFRGTGQDITSRIKAERERINLQENLRQAQKMESIGNLAGGIAHDFNNILSSVIGFTELALDDAAKGTPQEDNLQEVYTAGKRARDLVKQILAFARQSDEERKPIRVDTIAKEVLKLIRSTIPTTIEIREDIECRSLIMGNPSQVHQLFMNLCTNAAQAMEDAGGILEVGLSDVIHNDQSPLPLSGLKSGNYIKVTVSDTGSGILPDIIDSIFEPYFTTKGVGEGTGMGLALAHGIVESYGGKITVESEFGKGTVFSIYLPITKKHEDYQPYEKETLPSGTESILFVDDELPIAKMGSQILERLGYSVTTRTSSIEALELFQAKPNDFDLVVADMTMPNLTGDKLAVELMKIRQDIPVILCTGYSKRISDETASELGIKAFAYKPVVKADLAKTVRKVLDEAKGTTRA